MSISKNKSDKRVLTILTGEHHASFLNSIYTNYARKSQFLFLINISDASKKPTVVPESDIYDCGEIQNYEAGLDYVRQNRNVFEERIKSSKAEKLILMNALRFGNYGGILSGLSDISSNLGLETEAVIATSFDSEGLGKNTESKITQNYMEDNGVALKIFLYGAVAPITDMVELMLEIEKFYEESLRFEE